MFSYFFQLLGGFYLQELLAGLLFFQKKDTIFKSLDRLFGGKNRETGEVKNLAQSNLDKKNVLKVIRQETFMIYAILFLSTLSYGAYWYMVILILAVRGFIISFANNLPHYATPTNDRTYGLNLFLPPYLHLFFLNFYHHRLHHRNPTLPWTQLPAAMKEAGDSFDMSYLQAAMAQLKGPVAITTPQSETLG